MSKTKNVISVSQLSRKIRNLLDIDIGEVWVEGEISNLRVQSSGHQYFTLKDDKAQLSCAFFRGRASRNATQLKDGQQIRVFANLDLYTARGTLQLIVIKAEDIGQGELQARFEALKAKLDAEGLFANEHKLAIPSFPRRLAMITSPTGAAVEDMTNVLRRRAPWVQLILYPTRVQGSGAEHEIANGIGYLNQLPADHPSRPELIILGRGGGSLEDLWNFNEEVVARAIYASRIPIISAVGHEIDFTIADFVADLRAPTPSAAAELAVPDGDTLRQRLSELRHLQQRRTSNALDLRQRDLKQFAALAMRRTLNFQLQQRMQKLDELTVKLNPLVRQQIQHRQQTIQQLQLKLKAAHPARQQQRNQEHLSQLGKRMTRASRIQIENQSKKLKQLHALLNNLGPEKTLSRGFSITFDQSGQIIRDADAVAPGTRLKTMLKSGTLHSRATPPEN